MKETKIMIVEDDLDQAVGLSVRLRANGYKVLFASDGTTAFTQACQLLPDLIILDIGLPAGDGFKVIEWLAGMVKTAVIPVIVLSGRDPSVTRGRVLMMGAKAFFQKPIDNDIMLNTIREVLNTNTAVNNYVPTVPTTPDTHSTSSEVCSMSSRLARWRKELQENPGDTELMTDIAQVVASSSDPEVRNADEAMQMLRRAMSLMGAPTAEILDTLGIIYAGKGQFPQALLAARKACGMASASGQTAQAFDIQRRIKLYENNQVPTD